MFSAFVPLLTFVSVLPLGGRVFDVWTWSAYVPGPSAPVGIVHQALWLGSAVLLLKVQPDVAPPSVPEATPGAVFAGSYPV